MAQFQSFNSEPAVASADELLSIKLLEKANPEVFGGLAREETKWLAGAFKLLEVSPYLRSKLNGKGIAQAGQLAAVLKNRAETLFFQSQIDEVVDNFIAHEKNSPSLAYLDDFTDTKLFNGRGNWGAPLRRGRVFGGANNNNNSNSRGNTQKQGGLSSIEENANEDYADDEDDDDDEDNMQGQPIMSLGQGRRDATIIAKILTQ